MFDLEYEVKYINIEVFSTNKIGFSKINGRDLTSQEKAATAQKARLIADFISIDQNLNLIKANLAIYSLNDNFWKSHGRLDF